MNIDLLTFLKLLAITNETHRCYDATTANALYSFTREVVKVISIKKN